MILTALTATLSLIVTDTPPKKLDIKLDKVTAPQMDMPDLGTSKVPKAEGLKGDQGATSTPQLKQTEGETTSRRNTTITVEKVVHATEFVTKGMNRVPKGTPISELNLYTIPAHIPPFKTCFTLNSPDGMTTPIMVALRGPNGETLLANRGDVQFDGPGKMDFVVDWAGFDARMAGDYKISIQLGVQKSQDFVLPMKVGK